GAEHQVPRHDIHHVGAHATDLIQHHGLCTLTDGNQDDYRADTDDDAEHCERCAQLVTTKRARSNFDNREQVHSPSSSSSSRGSCWRTTLASLRFSTGTSR